MNFTDAFIRKERGHGITPKSDNYFGADNLNLPVQPSTAAKYFLRQWVTIYRRAALDYIGNIDLLTVQPDRSQQFIQEFTCRTYERTPLLIFVKARGFPNEHYISVFCSLTRYDFDSGPGNLTSITASNIRIKLAKR
jgi:hypothetical protein